MILTPLRFWRRSENPWNARPYDGTLTRKAPVKRPTWNHRECHLIRSCGDRSAQLSTGLFCSSCTYRPAPLHGALISLFHDPKSASWSWGRMAFCCALTQRHFATLCLSYCNLYALPLALTNFLGSENISMNRCLSSKKMEGTRPTAQEDQRPCRRKLPSLSALGVHTEESVKRFQSDRYTHLGISMPEDVSPRSRFSDIAVVRPSVQVTDPMNSLTQPQHDQGKERSFCCLNAHPSCYRCRRGRCRRHARTAQGNHSVDVLGTRLG